MIVLLGLLMKGVLSDKHFGYLLEVAERAGRQRVKPIQCHTFQTGGKNDAQEWIIAGVDHHFSPKCLMCWTGSLIPE